MLRQALLDAGVALSTIETIPDETEAVATALALAEAGDLLLIFGDNIKRTWQQITDFQSTSEGEQAGSSAPLVSEKGIPVR